MSSILVVGSMAFDCIETPFGKVDKVLGGSANYFSLAASYFTKINCVSVVGQDYPDDHIKVLQSKGIDVDGIRREKGNTFYWEGRYGYDMNEAHTLDTQLNVFEGFNPQLPAAYQDSPYVFLGNIVPALQSKVLDQVKSPKFIALDSMNFWIEGQKEELIKVISRCDALVLNEAEARQLTESYNIVKAAEVVRNWGPKILVVKRGEYGALLFDNGEMFSIPGLPLADVKDPTGAGDSFAGGFLGYIASQSDQPFSRYTLRKAVVYGSAMASFNVEEFGFKQLLNLERKVIEERYQHFVDLTTFHTF